MDDCHEQLLETTLKYSELVEKFTDAVNTLALAQEGLKKASADHTKATETINQLTAQLDQSTQSNNMLMQFIKGKGFQPPPMFEA